MILEEFDETLTSTFDPYEVENVIEGFPKIGVTCFSKKLFDQLLISLMHFYEIYKTLWVLICLFFHL